MAKVNNVLYRNFYRLRHVVVGRWCSAHSIENLCVVWRADEIRSPSYILIFLTHKQDIAVISLKLDGF